VGENKRQKSQCDLEVNQQVPEIAQQLGALDGWMQITLLCAAAQLHQLQLRYLLSCTKAPAG
jgi:hypothetical protein